MYKNTMLEWLEPTRPLHLAWRTTATHSVKEMMSVYREIYFAGFPAVAGETPFPENVVRSMFQMYGNITSFVYDTGRGIGSVLYESGEDAEHCFVDLHLSVIPGGARSERDWLSESFGSQSALIYIEFAQFLPFVNPLFFERSLAPETVTRKLLRTFPALPLSDAATSTMVISVSSKTDDIVLPGGPGFLTQSAQAQQVILLLGKEFQGKTVLDLWESYCQMYVYRKTQPEVTKLKHRQDHLFATKASVYQQIRNSLRGKEELADQFLQNVDFNKSMSYLVYNCRAKYDPTIVSYWRSLSWVTRVSDGGNDESIDDDGSHAQQHEEELLSRSIVDMTLHLIKNGQTFYGKEGDQFQCAAALLDEFATSGAASSIVECTSPPEHFHGPNGLAGSRRTSSSILWSLLRYPVGIVLFFVALIVLMR